MAGVDAPLFATDNAGGVASVLNWLQARGHHDVAFVGGPQWISTGSERRPRTWLAVRRTASAWTTDCLTPVTSLLMVLRRPCIAFWIGAVLPTAVFGTNGPTTLGAMRALRRRLGPEHASRIDVVSFDDLDWFEFAVPAVSGVRNDAAAIGRLGVQGLLDLLAGRTVASQRVPTSFVDRAGPLTGPFEPGQVQSSTVPAH
jgi:LacI family transcriptional regulator